jgi:flavin reductase (DIM6/NTAB) family NADH-FMN oxidoreductase RutF
VRERSRLVLEGIHGLPVASPSGPTVAGVFYEPDARDLELLPHDPFKALIVPRPVGWISTLGPDGAPNLAPYSFFNAVCDRPPMLAFSSAGRKDSMTFAGGRGEFVWNLATFDLREAMNRSSAELPRGESEFEHAGLTPAPCRHVAPPRVAESPAALECRVLSVTELVDLDGRSSDHHLVLGQVVGVHLDDAAVRAGRVDTAALRPIARCGYRGDYAVVDALFDMPRPA